MRRKRYQRGSVRPRKHGRHKIWVAQWWEEGRKRTKVLGKVSEVTRAEAEAQMSVILARLNSHSATVERPVYTFRQYVEGVYLPVCRRKWKESTWITNAPQFQRYLIPAFGSFTLRSITREQLQAFLDSKTGELSASVISHLRWWLNAIFRMAQSDGLVEFNPAGSLFTPASKEPAAKRFLNLEQVRTLLAFLKLRERLIFRMAVFEGMRPGEILAVQLGKIEDTSLLVDQRLYKGTLDTPKGRKGKRTSRVVALSEGTRADLTAWRQFLPTQKADQWLFPTERNTPLCAHNLWNRYLKPQLQEVGLAWANFQVYRRTNAQLSRKALIDDKVAADQRGHSLGVSLEVYAQSDLEQKIAMVRRLESEVIQ